jgi:hypothetical protein
MPMPTHENIRKAGDIQVTYKFNLKFTKMPATGKYPNLNDVNIRCQTTQVPKKSTENISYILHGHEVNQNGMGKYSGTIEFTFIETVDNKIKDFIIAWAEASHTTITGASVDKSKLEAIVQLEMLGTDLKPIYLYTLTGCIYKDHTMPDLDGASSEAYKPTLTINYDYHTPPKKP